MTPPILIRTTEPTNLHFDTKFFVSEKEQISIEINSIVKGFFAYVTELKTPKKDVPVYYIDKHTAKVSYSGGAEYGSEQEVIIMTNDTHLIEGGVQAIEDEFLNYFVENPSCNDAEIHSVELCENCGQQHCDNYDCKGYKDEKYYLISTPKNTVKKITTYCDGYEISTETIKPKEDSTKSDSISNEERKKYFEEKEKNKKALIEAMYEVHRNRKELKQELLPDFKLSKSIFNKIGELNASKDNTEYSEIDKKAMDLLKDKWQHLYMFGYPQKPFPKNYESDLNLVKLVLYESPKNKKESNEAIELSKDLINRKAKSEAFEFKVDYKPFEEDLNYKEYAEYGFEKGFIEGIEWLQKNILQLLKDNDYQNEPVFEFLTEQFEKKYE
jgi:hypothetical protein